MPRPGSTSCQSPCHALSRRRVLGLLGGSSGFGSLLQPAIAREIAKKERQVCLIWLDGGISQLESWPSNGPAVPNMNQHSTLRHYCHVFKRNEASPETVHH